MRVLPDGTTATLLSQEPHRDNVVKSPTDMSYYMHGWDIGADGTIIYGDPDGKYRVIVGHSPDGVSQAIELPEWEGDEARYREIVNKSPASVRGSILRVAGVQWLNDQYFLVRPTAELPDVRGRNTIGTLEVFRRDGDSLGRYSVYCELDTNNDSFFIRGNVLIVVRGIRDVARAAYSAVITPHAEPGAAVVNEVRVRAYELFPDILESH